MPASLPLVARSDSPERSRQIAAAVAELARPGDLLLLVGDLGAGKTAFTKGFGAGLGVTEPITSPTFALVRGYEGRLRLHHLDVYRLEQIEEAADLGLSELLDDGSVTVIEWGDTITAVLPHDYLELSITFGEDDDDRSLEFRCIGAQWRSRFGALRLALGPWLDEPGSAESDSAESGSSESGSSESGSAEGDEPEC